MRKERGREREKKQGEKEAENSRKRERCSDNNDVVRKENVEDQSAVRKAAIWLARIE